MDSFTWTEIKTPSSISQSIFTLSAITDSQLVLYKDWWAEGSKPWIFDIPSRSWKQYTMIAEYADYGYTVTTGLNSVVIIGGDRYMYYDDNRKNEKNGFISSVLHIKLRPESLQQLAMKTIHQHQTEVPLGILPQKLLCRITGTEIIEFACSNK